MTARNVLDRGMLILHSEKSAPATTDTMHFMQPPRFSTMKHGGY
jgi:hypothetical protein